MFENMVESAPTGRGLKDRRRYFVVSSILVGVLFTAAVVVSIFAADYGIGGQFELVEMIAPVAAEAVDPETIEPEPRRSNSAVSELPTRQTNMARVEESPTGVPDTVSTTRNTQLARPATGRFIIGATDTEPAHAGGSGRSGDTVGSPQASLTATASTPIEPDEAPPPPDIKRTGPPKAPVSKGVLNGRAKELPKPIYSATARAVGAQGQVNVQVVIDESGRVISANAVSGHVLLRADAEKAARSARFTPTLLSDVPVKVTGIITYNFTR